METQTGLRRSQLEAPPISSPNAMGATITVLVGVAVELTTQVTRFETGLSERFARRVQR